MRGETALRGRKTRIEAKRVKDRHGRVRGWQGVEDEEKGGEGKGRERREKRGETEGKRRGKEGVVSRP